MVHFHKRFADPVISWMYHWLPEKQCRRLLDKLGIKNAKRNSFPAWFRVAEQLTASYLVSTHLVDVLLAGIVSPIRPSATQPLGRLCKIPCTCLQSMGQTWTNKAIYIERGFLELFPWLTSVITDRLDVPSLADKWETLLLSRSAFSSGSGGLRWA